MKVIQQDKDLSDFYVLSILCLTESCKPPLQLLWITTLLFVPAKRTKRHDCKLVLLYSFRVCPLTCAIALVFYFPDFSVNLPFPWEIPHNFFIFHFRYFVILQFSMRFYMGLIWYFTLCRTLKDHSDGRLCWDKQR